MPKLTTSDVRSLHDQVQAIAQEIADVANDMEGASIDELDSRDGDTKSAINHLRGMVTTFLTNPLHKAIKQKAQ